MDVIFRVILFESFLLREEFLKLLEFLDFEGVEMLGLEWV